jgi:hypothetical protein
VRPRRSRPQLLEQVDRGERRDGRSRTIGELVERWLEWRQQVRPISPVTVANYRGAIDQGDRQGQLYDTQVLTYNQQQMMAVLRAIRGAKADAAQMADLERIARAVFGGTP